MCLIFKYNIYIYVLTHMIILFYYLDKMSSSENQNMEIVAVHKIRTRAIKQKTCSCCNVSL